MMASTTSENINTNAAPSGNGSQPQQLQSQAQVPVLMSPHDIVASHLYHVGFVQGLHSDLLVRAQFVGAHAQAQAQAQALLASQSTPAPLTQPQEAVFKLHKLLAVRSPYMAALIQDMEMRADSYGQPLELLLPITDPNITTEGLSIAFGHLYADYSISILTNSLNNATSPELRLSLLKGVLSASCLLHLNNLSNLAAELIKNDISRSTLAEYCAFVTQQTETVAPATPSSAGTNGSPQQHQQQSSTWVLEIRDAIFAFLCKGLVREISERRNALIWGNKGSEAYKELVAAFAELPFEWLKKVIEGREFEVPNDMERFAFAKEVVALRARNQRALKSGGAINNLVAGEENVLLAFGGAKAGGASGVTIVRKAPKMTPAPMLQQQYMQKQQHQQMGYGAAGQQYMQQQGQPGSQNHLGYSLMDQYSDPQQQQQQQQQQYMQTMGAQGFMPPQERRVWKAGN
ncbi:hypothetical protein BJ741DRAFT_651813 [Chytriomyces cf. hyalinus JEL632]|nr:hypothetical protein BJ741DRAFT_651813 [Chytriomyces cf. hyalinus JEL632]